jgi:hypothetical protein
MTRGAPALAGLLLVAASLQALGHDLSVQNAAFVRDLDGTAFGAFTYLGAKHMFTGYDHLLFLLGVIFYLYRPRDILLYVSLFTLGHSLTLLAGVFAGWQVNSHLVDAVIGLSIVYKAFENIGGFRVLFGIQPDPRWAVLLFGLCHGFGLASKLQGDMGRGEGWLQNLLGFNLGVELGQVAALLIMLGLLLRWRGSEGFARRAFVANMALMCAGFLLTGYQAAGYWFA